MKNDGPQEEKIHSQETQIYFDKLAFHEGVNEDANIDKYVVIKSLLGSAETHAHILECGGGAGFYTRRLLRDGYIVTCIDSSEQALLENRKQATALKKQDSLEIVHGDFVTVAKLLEKRFDQILFIKVFHHFSSLSHVFSALDVAINSCRDNGRIIIFEPNGANKLWRLFLTLVRDKVSGKSKWYYEQNMKFTTERNFRNYLDKKGIRYELNYHYVIPAFLLKLNIPGVRVVNAYLEKSIFRKMAFNLSIVVYI